MPLRREPIHKAPGFSPRGLKRAVRQQQQPTRQHKAKTNLLLGIARQTKTAHISHVPDTHVCLAFQDSQDKGQTRNPHAKHPRTVAGKGLRL